MLWRVLAGHAELAAVPSPGVDTRSTLSCTMNVSPTGDEPSTLDYREWDLTAEPPNLVGVKFR